MATLLLLGIPASGQLSVIIGLAVGVVAIGLLARRFTRLGVLVLGVAPIAGLVFRPVVAARLSDIDPATGLPESWIFRLRNLRTHFWPELFSNFNFVLGVRPSARIRAPESWRDYVWIESGHTWLLWTGGIPLFLAFWWFLVVPCAGRPRSRGPGPTRRHRCPGELLGSVRHRRADDPGPHLTLRGTADLLFALLALACTAASAGRERGTT